MLNKYSKSVLVALLLVLPVFGYAQATLTSTTLSAAVSDASTGTIRVTSATGFSVGYLAYVDREVLRVNAISGTAIRVTRGQEGTAGTPHLTGTTIFVGPPGYFTNYDRSGGCTATSLSALPLISFVSGTWWDCVGGYWVPGNYTVVAPRRAAGAYGRGKLIVDPSNIGFFSSTGDAKKTYATEYGLSRTTGYAVTGDSNDAVIKGSYSNYAANDANFQTRIFLGTMSNRSGGVVGVLNGAQFNASNKSGGTASSVVGLQVGTENFGTNATEHGGIDVYIKNEAAAATTDYGIRIRNIDQSNVGAAQAAVLIPANAGNTVGWNYGIDQYGATINTAAMRLKGGNMIMSGTADPNGAVTGTDGSIYLRTGTATASTILYVCTGTTTWTAVTVP
ncbi:MAG: hypothetical protein WC378_17865 [Opitutaceae bacterium]|jgi:hypothetical protein